MSVRRRNRHGKNGTTVKWMVDINFQHADGRCERIRKLSPVQTKRGAEQYDRLIRDALLRGSVRAGVPNIELGVAKEPKVERPFFAAYAKEFVDVYARSHNKPSEVSGKISIFQNHLVPMFGKMRLDEISVRSIEAYKQKKREGKLAAKTINNHLATLSKCLHTAAQWDLLTVVPRIQQLPLPPPTFHFLQYEEADRLIAAADGQWRAMCIVAVRAGLRLGELRALRWADVDLAAGKLIVRQAAWRMTVGSTKSGRLREVALSNQAQQALSDLSKVKGPFVFCAHDNTMLTKESCKRPLWRACKNAGLDRRIGWHVLRHTFASHLVMRGANLKAVQELLGHADIKITMRYAHLTASARREAISLLDVP